MATDDNQNLTGHRPTPSLPELDTSIPPGHANDQTSSALDEGSAAESVTVLFIDIVGFAKLPVNQQRQALKELLKAVRSTDEYQRANAAVCLLRLPTGDGMALVFLNTTPVAPACCAKNIRKALRSGSRSCGIRMGIHSGPVYRDQDIDDKPNVTGDGINLAQRVMNCGDDRHILLSASVAEFLKAFDDWARQIHDLGEVKVKHDKLMHIFNLYGDDFGNPSPPRVVRARDRQRYMLLGGTALLAALLFLAVFLVYYLRPSPGNQKIDSIAIFPFTVIDNSNDGDLKNAAEDIALHIRNDLVDVSNLTVKPAPDSLRRYREMKEIDAIAEGRSLDVQVVLKGSIIKQGDGAVIEVSLTNVQTNSHMWSFRYPYSASATKQISEDIIPRLLKKAISKEEHDKLDKNYTNNATAANLYNEARRLLIQRKELGTSIDLFRKAIEQDPNYSQAHAGLATALSLSPGYDVMRPEQAYTAAQEEVRKALDIDNKNVEAYYTSGYIRANYEWDWENARKDFERALELSKNHDADALYVYAFNYLIPMKRMDEAIRTMQAALSIDPNSAIINTNLGWTYYYAGRDKEAFDQYQKTLGKYPDFSRVHRRLQDYYDKNKNYPAALEEYAKLEPDDTKLREALQTRGERGYWEHRLRKMEDRAARGSYVPLYDKAAIYANMGKTEEALSLLEEAVLERSEGLIKVNVNPVFQNLRSNPRFIKVIQSLHLPT
jgi:tetratricopeptide (TPR) repeat protein/class 3 adenylate cyclase